MLFELRYVAYGNLLDQTLDWKLLWWVLWPLETGLAMLWTGTQYRHILQTGARHVTISSMLQKLPCLQSHLLKCHKKRHNGEGGSQEGIMEEKRGPLVQARSDSGPRRSLADEQVKGGVIAHRLVKRMKEIIRPSTKRTPERTWVLQRTAQNLSQLKV